MAASSTKAGSGARKAFAVVALVAVLLAVGLSAGWYYLASEIERRVLQTIEAARASGVTLTCVNQGVFGYPFRLGLNCDATGVDAPQSGLRATTGGLRTAAQIYEPTRIVAELDGPALLESATLPPLDLRWSLAQASATFWTEGAETISVLFDQPVVALSQPAADRLPLAEADRLEIHARRRDGDLDVAFSDRGVDLLAPGLGALPVFDASGDLTVDGAADWLSGKIEGRTPREALAGRTVTVRSVKLDVGDAHAELSGAFEVNASGQVSGDFELAVAKPERIAAIVGGIAPQLARIANSVAAGISFLGRRVNGRSIIPLTIENGEVSSGFVPLGVIPPLR